MNCAFCTSQRPQSRVHEHAFTHHQCAVTLNLPQKVNESQASEGGKPTFAASWQAESYKK